MIELLLYTALFAITAAGFYVVLFMPKAPCPYCGKRDNKDGRCQWHNYP